MARAYEGVGFFEKEWKNPPAPFNPDYDPLAKARYERVTRSMEKDDFYSGHTRDECAVEWKRRYEQFKAEDDAKKMKEPH